jgi:YesN/AraC family two-component response regulator
MVADRFDFAPAYFSQLFKDSTGENFSVVLEQTRIDNACVLLKTGVPVGEVSEKVGYNSVYVFRNAFNRVVGLAPQRLLPQGRRHRANQPAD